MNLWQRENENSLICQNFQIEAHNSTEAKTETGSSTAEPGRGKEMGHIFSASHFQLDLFSNKELKIKIHRTLWLARGNNVFSVFQLTVCQVVRGKQGRFIYLWKNNSSKIAVDKISGVTCLGTAEDHPLHTKEEQGIHQNFGHVPKPTGDFPWDQEGDE